MCAVKFLRLEEFIDDNRHGIALHMEPQGLLFAEAVNYFRIYLLICVLLPYYTLSELGKSILFAFNYSLYCIKFKNSRWKVNRISFKTLGV